jgi:tetratricopeptide (TPR) repeat protein
MPVLLLIVLLLAPVFSQAAQGRSPDTDARFEASYDYLRAQVEAQGGREVLAVRLLKRAAELDPDSLPLQRELAARCLTAGDGTGAVDALGEAIRLAPDDDTLKLQAAGLCVELDRKGEAEAWYRSVLQRDPAQPEALRFLAALRQASGHPSEAGDLLQQALEAHPESIPVRMQWGQWLAGQGLGDSATAQYRQVLKQDPTYVNAWQRLGEMAESRGELAAAAAQYEQGLEKDASNVALKSALAHVHYQQGQAALAEKEFSGLLDEGGTPGDRLYRGLARLQLSRWSEAQEDFEALSTTAGAGLQGPRQYGLGLALMGQKRYPAAEQTFLSALKFNPQSVPLYSELGILYQDTSRTAKAVDLFEGAAKDYPKVEDLHLLLAALYADRKDFPKAEATLQRGMESLPKNANLHFQLAVTFDKAGDAPGAERELKKTLELDPKHAEAMNYLAYTWADRGLHLDQAVPLLQRALQLDPGNPYFMDSLAWALHKQGKDRQASGLLETAEDKLGVKAGPEDSVLYEHLAEIYARLGRKQESRRQQQKAHSLKDHEDAHAFGSRQD